MAAEFGMEAGSGDGRPYDVLGPFKPDEFRLRYMGMSDRRPLFGGKADIREAAALISGDTGRFGVAHLVTPPPSTLPGP